MGKSVERHLQPLRRRMIWSRRWRRIEISLLLTGMAALVFSAILFLLGQSTLAASATILIAGGVIATAWAACVRVTWLSAAIHADRRLGLNDLLATAWSIEQTPASDDPWHRAVLATAENRCQELKLADPDLPLINGRIWSVIALAMALIVCLGDWVPQANKSQVSLATVARISSTSGQSAPPASGHQALQQMRPAGAAAINENSNRPGNNMNADSADGKPSNSPANIGEGSMRASADGAGSASSGLARTSAQIASPSELPLSSEPSNHTSGGLIAGGGAPSNQPLASGPASQGRGAHQRTTAAAPWRSNAWPAAQAAAAQSLQNGRIDPEYQEMVRDYFRQ